MEVMDKMTYITSDISTIEDARNDLMTHCPKEPPEQRAGYINGVLDMYNAAKRLRDNSNTAHEDPKQPGRMIR